MPQYYIPETTNSSEYLAKRFAHWHSMHVRVVSSVFLTSSFWSASSWHVWARSVRFFFFQFLSSRTDLSPREIRLGRAYHVHPATLHFASVFAPVFWDCRSSIDRAICKRRADAPTNSAIRDGAELGRCSHNAFTLLSMCRLRHVRRRPPRELIFLARALRFIGRPYNSHKSHARNSGADFVLG